MNLLKGIKAKTRNKNFMPSWFQERIDICSECSENTKNITKISLKNKIRLSHNFGKDACLLCSCGIKDLASDPTVKCSAKSPKWDWIQPPNFDIKFNLKNYSPSRGNLTREGKYYYYNFGNIKYDSSFVATLLFDVKEELNNFKVISSCGCTKPDFTRKKEGYLINVSYDTTIVGSFEKQVSISFTSKIEKKEFLTFWIKGEVLS